MQEARSFRHEPMRCRGPRAASITVLALLAAMLLLSGCASGYRYRFEPMPAVVEVHTSQGTLPLMLVSVLGAITPEGSDQRQVHVRYRLQNATSRPLSLPVGRQRLLTGDLLEFSSAWLVAGVTEVAPGQSALADLAFAFPDDSSPDLRGLSLGWVLVVEGVELGNTVAFQRVQPDVPRYPYGPQGWGPYGVPPWGLHGPYGYGWYGPYHRH